MASQAILDLLARIEAKLSLNAELLGRLVPLASPPTLNLNSSLKTQESDSEREGSGGRKPRRKQRTAIPDGFTCDERSKNLALGLGLNPHRELAAFRDNCLANDRVFKDWQAAFRNWLRKGQRFAQKGRWR